MPNVIQEPLLVSGAECARRLGISRATFMRRVAEGVFSRIELPGGSAKYNMDIVAEELAAHINAPRAQQR